AADGRVVQAEAEGALYTAIYTTTDVSTLLGDIGVEVVSLDAPFIVQDADAIARAVGKIPIRIVEPRHRDVEEATPGVRDGRIRIRSGRSDLEVNAVAAVVGKGHAHVPGER